MIETEIWNVKGLRKVHSRLFIVFRNITSVLWLQEAEISTDKNMKNEWIKEGEKRKRAESVTD
jgi:hypothetical protein